VEDESIYHEIFEDLCGKIKSGAYPENTPLPAERVLCVMYHVSRSTIRRSLELLERGGFITKAHGNGNFVKPQMFEQKLAQFHSFAGSLKAQHILIKNQTLDYELIVADNYLDGLDPSLFGNTRALRWHKLVRLRFAENFPLMIETSYLPQSRFLSLDMECLETGSLYAFLESRYCMSITDAYELLSPINPTSKERSALRIPPHIPCMQIERFCHENDCLIAIHRTIIRGDKYKFKADYYVNDAPISNDTTN